MALIAFATAKRHLRITTTDQDSDILLKLSQAEAIILARCNSTAHWRAITPTWTSVTVPPAVQAAILIKLTDLVEHRGDDPEQDAATWQAIENLLALSKDPVIA